MTWRALAEVNKGINMRNIYHDKSVFILRRGFEHIVELRRRTEVGKNLILREYFTPRSYPDPIQTPYQLPRSSGRIGKM